MAKTLNELRVLGEKFHMPRMDPELRRKLALGIPIRPTTPERMREIVKELKAKKAP